ncbi:hypothetical protein IEQ34_016613 [Dendrobium chrysotoxum]|uniref:Uncharacterized protein n=1 Tax=Dendrobium chrysotoxum TaxID=161865 RepID=A0AAV7GFL3_DENCH|nr:hypothetical protein IEQ34_016613 [Dendrobium chrysotoxum]
MGTRLHAILDHRLVPFDGETVITAAGVGMDDQVVEGRIKAAIDGSASICEGLGSIVEAASAGKGGNGGAVDVRETRAGEDTPAGGSGGGARTGMSDKKAEEEAEIVEAGGGGEGASHVLVGGMVMAEGVGGGGGPEENVEIVGGKERVVMEAAAEEVE